MVGWLEPVARYAGMAEWLPSWHRNGDVHRDTEPYLHWNALCQSHRVSRSMKFQKKKKFPLTKMTSPQKWRTTESKLKQPNALIQETNAEFNFPFLELLITNYRKIWYEIVICRFCFFEKFEKYFLTFFTKILEIELVLWFIELFLVIPIRSFCRGIFLNGNFFLQLALKFKYWNFERWRQNLNIVMSKLALKFEYLNSENCQKFRISNSQNWRQNFNVQIF